MNSIEQRQSDQNVLQHDTNRSHKRKHTPIKLVQKIEICKIKSTNPTIKNVELASRYGIGESTITGILKNNVITCRFYPIIIPRICVEKNRPNIQLSNRHWLFGLTK